VEKRLAGCVQITGPTVSTYWWKENIAKTKEWLCLIKSRKDLYEETSIAVRDAVEAGKWRSNTRKLPERVLVRDLRVSGG
jgi:hypothetical protein